MVSSLLLTGCAVNPSDAGQNASQESTQEGASNLDSQHLSALDSFWLQNFAGYSYLYDIDGSGDPLLLVAKPSEGNNASSGAFEVDYYKFNPSSSTYEQINDLKSSMGGTESSQQAKIFLDKSGNLYSSTVNKNKEVSVKKLVKSNDTYSFEDVQDEAVLKMAQSDESNNDTYSPVPWNGKLASKGTSLNKLREAKASQGKMVIKGIVHFYDDEEIAKAQGYLNPNSPSDKKSTVVVFDQPIYFSSPVAQAPRESYMCALNGSKVNSFYDGKEVYLAFDPTKVKWDNTTAMPMGEPRISDYEFLW